MRARRKMLQLVASAGKVAHTIAIFRLISDYGNPLGVESGVILDHQFSSSSAARASFEPFKARLNSDAAWCMADNSLTEYLQIDLLTQHVIQQVCLELQVS